MRMSERSIGSLLVVAIQLLDESLIVEMNIDQIPQCRTSNAAMQLGEKRMAYVRSD
jgi:hypothetical protein